MNNNFEIFSPVNNAVAFNSSDEKINDARTRDDISNDILLFGSFNEIYSPINGIFNKDGDDFFTVVHENGFSVMVSIYDTDLKPLKLDLEQEIDDGDFVKENSILFQNFNLENVVVSVEIKNISEDRKLELLKKINYKNGDLIALLKEINNKNEKK